MPGRAGRKKSPTESFIIGRCHRDRPRLAAAPSEGEFCRCRPRTLEREEWPLVVWAPPQASNAKSLMRINPDLLPQLSGFDVAVERITLTPTTDRAPTRLAAFARWLDAMRRDRVTYHRSNQSVALADLERRR